MVKVLLYYPSINIPDEDWIKNAILYTDKVSSILPFDNMLDARIPDSLKDLHNLGQYHPIFINEEFSNNEYVKENLDLFEKDFIKTIESSPYHEFKKELLKQNNKTFDDCLVYDNKFTQYIRDYLKKEKLLVYTGSGVYVDRFASTLYLSKLTQFISNSKSDQNFIPCTVHRQVEKMCFYLMEGKKEKAVRITLNILPYVSGKVSFKEIADLKKKFDKERINLTVRLDEFQTKLINTPLEHQSTVIREFENEINREILEIKTIIKKNNYEIALNNGVSSLFPNAAHAGAITGQGIVTTKGIVSISVISISPSVHYRNDKMFPENKTLSYFYHINKFLT